MTAREAMDCDYRTQVSSGGEDGGGPATAVALHCRVHDHPWPCPRDPAKPAPVRKGRRTHIIREAPPWRHLDPAAVDKTECGRAVDGDALIAEPRAAVIARVRTEGRSALEGFCQVCRGKCELFRDATWARDPGALLARDIGDWSGGSDRLNAELWMLAALAAAHPEEATALLTGAVAILHPRQEAPA